jgi:hypothetical protein
MEVRWRYCRAQEDAEQDFADMIYGALVSPEVDEGYEQTNEDLKPKAKTTRAESVELTAAVAERSGTARLL